jgi:hypothetical protein
MAKQKIDIVIDGITYKNIDIYVSSFGGGYMIDTTGIAQIMRQYVKNNFGDIKVWVRSDSYANGSSVNLYLWNVPKEWYNQVKDFAERFSRYDSGNGWRDKKIGAFTTDGKDVDNFSPIMFVYNKPPYDSKESDMTPPNYEDMPKPKKKEYKGKFEKKGAKFSPTDNLDLILDCGNGWKIYVGKPKEKYLYNVVKDGDTQPNREQWAEIKSDMLEAGFMWGYKSGTFQRWTTMPDDTIPQKACDVLSKYWGGASQPKEENPKEETPKEDGKIPLVKVVDVWGQFGTPNKEFTNFEDLEKEFFQTEIPAEGYDKYKFKFEWADGSYIIDRIDVGYSESDFNPSVRTFEDYVDYLYNTSSEKISVFYEYEMKEPFNRYSTKFSNEPKEEKPKEFKVGDKVRLFKDIDKKYYPNNQELELGDIGIVKNREGYLNMYDVEFNGKEIYLDSSYFELVEKAPTKEVNLDQYIDDLNLLLELTPNESKKLELATYISDLNTLKLLQ